MSVHWTFILWQGVGVHGETNPLFGGAIQGLGIPGVGMTENAHHWIVAQNSSESLVCSCSPVGDDHLPGMLTESDPDTAAMME